MLNKLVRPSTGGIIALSPCVADPHVVALELRLAGKRLGSVTLIEEGALDLALRLK